MCLDLMSAMIIYVYMLQELHYYIKHVLNSHTWVCLLSGQ